VKCFLAQDLTTVRVASGVAVIQPEADYVDLAGYREVFVWLDVREVTPTATPPTIAFQSAVTKDESLFATILSASPSAVGLSVLSAIPELTTPFSRWFRWQLSAPVGAAGDMTFRLWVVANRSGRRPFNRSITTPSST